MSRDLKDGACECGKSIEYAEVEAWVTHWGNEPTGKPYFLMIRLICECGREYDGSIEFDEFEKI